MCNECHREEKKLYQEIKYGLRVLKTMPRKSLKERKLYKKKINEINHKQRKLKVKQQMHKEDHTVDCKVNNKFNTEKLEDSNVPWILILILEQCFWHFILALVDMI